MGGEKEGILVVSIQILQVAFPNVCNLWELSSGILVYVPRLVLYVILGCAVVSSWRALVGMLSLIPKFKKVNHPHPDLPMVCSAWKLLGMLPNQQSS